MNMVRRELPAQAKPVLANPRASAQRPGSAGPQGLARPSASPAAMRPAVKSEDLFQVIRQLSDLLTKENSALKRHRPEDVKALTERKEQLARLYQSHMNGVHRDPEILRALEPSKREAMTQSAMRLGELMQENASLLKANIQSINMFFKAVTDALKARQEEKVAAYSRSGSLNGYAVTKRSLAVSFNQTM